MAELVGMIRSVSCTIVTLGTVDLVPVGEVVTGVAPLGISTEFADAASECLGDKCVLVFIYMSARSLRWMASNHGNLKRN